MNEREYIKSEIEKINSKYKTHLYCDFVDSTNRELEISTFEVLDVEVFIDIGNVMGKHDYYLQSIYAYYQTECESDICLSYTKNDSTFIRLVKKFFTELVNNLNNIGGKNE